MSAQFLMWKFPASLRIRLFFAEEQSVLFVQNTGKLLLLQEWAGILLQWMNDNPGCHETEYLKSQLSQYWQERLTVTDIESFMRQLMLDNLVMSVRS